MIPIKIERRESVIKWIPVSERLPEKSGRSSRRLGRTIRNEKRWASLAMSIKLTERGKKDE